MATTLHPANMNSNQMDPVARRTKKVNGFLIHLFVFVAVVGSLIVLNYTNNPGNMWSYWVLFGWGIGVACHAIRLFAMPDRWK